MRDDYYALVAAAEASASVGGGGAGEAEAGAAPGWPGPEGAGELWDSPPEPNPVLVGTRPGTELLRLGHIAMFQGRSKQGKS